ncbi:MAG: hypothetical protein M3115_07945 [Thermoproteota archaeon]|nr:hypothetical protein [Thermoproteota archaeon]
MHISSAIEGENMTNAFTGVSGTSEASVRTPIFNSDGPVLIGRIYR